MLAIVLLGGWLLLQPPTLRDSAGLPRAAEEAPMPRWHQVQAFDTAHECEAGREELKDSSGKMMSRTSDLDTPSSRQSRDSIHRAFVAAMASRCAPAEHLYPPRKPKPWLDQ